MLLVVAQDRRDRTIQKWESAVSFGGVVTKLVDNQIAPFKIMRTVFAYRWWKGCCRCWLVSDGLLVEVGVIVTGEPGSIRSSVIFLSGNITFKVQSFEKCSKVEQCVIHGTF